jgi:AcrR family transcriptional regulator
MKTDKKIKEVSRLLFNEKGVVNVTLRDVAKTMNKSYGNITYHFATKNELIMSIFEDMNTELTLLQKLNDTSNLFSYLLELPKYNYEITLKYLFFTNDYTEIKRNYANLFEKMYVLNLQRMAKWKEVLIELRRLDYFKASVSNEDLDYIMFLSMSIRSAYFQLNEIGSYNKSLYSKIVNQFLKPYLSDKGLSVFNDWYNSI